MFKKLASPRLRRIAGDQSAWSHTPGKLPARVGGARAGSDRPCLAIALDPSLKGACDGDAPRQCLPGAVVALSERYPLQTFSTLADQPGLRRSSPIASHTALTFDASA